MMRNGVIVANKGKLNYLEKSTHLELAYVVHQYTMLVANPSKGNVATVMHISRYL
jgi:hypothetical protein